MCGKRCWEYLRGNWDIAFVHTVTVGSDRRRVTSRLSSQGNSARHLPRYPGIHSDPYHCYKHSQGTWREAFSWVLQEQWGSDAEMLLPVGNTTIYRYLSVDIHGQKETRVFNIGRWKTTHLWPKCIKNWQFRNIFENEMKIPKYLRFCSVYEIAIFIYIFEYE